MDLWHKGDLSDPYISEQEIALKEYLELLLAACSKETSADQAGWTQENPLHGHCAVVAILVQENFGGEIFRASLLGVKGYEQMQSHYWNRLKNGSEVDLTAGQFRGNDRDLVPEGKSWKMDGQTKKEVPITRESLLSYEPTRRRYEILKKRVGDEWIRGMRAVIIRREFGRSSLSARLSACSRFLLYSKQ